MRLLLVSKISKFLFTSFGIYDERKYSTQFPWVYYNLIIYGYMCKVCEVFHKDKLCLVAAGRGAWSHCAVLLKDNPGKKFRRHEKSSWLLCLYFADPTVLCKCSLCSH